MFSGIDFSGIEIVFIVAGALAGGFANGLTGFGTGLTAMPFWLQGLTPALSTQLALGCSVIAQGLTFPAIWRSIDWKAVAPMLVAGLIGIPVGMALLPYIPVDHFKRAVGIILVAYASLMLAAGTRLRITAGGRGADAIVGLLGGVLGALAGLSGVVPTVWAALKGWSKERRRGVFQAFNLTILGVSLIAHMAGGLTSWRFLAALLLALPGTLLGVRLGQALYQRLDDRRFDRVVLVLLGVAGVGLLATTR